MSYTYDRLLSGVHIDDADMRIREALKERGFGVLTEIDVKETMKNKIGVDMDGYRILGACSPPLAHRALLEEDDIGLLLPCNVVVYEGSEPDTSVVSILDPVQQLAVAGRDDLGPMADEVQARLKRVMEAV